MADTRLNAKFSWESVWPIKQRQLTERVRWNRFFHLHQRDPHDPRCDSNRTIFLAVLFFFFLLVWLFFHPFRLEFLFLRRWRNSTRVTVAGTLCMKIELARSGSPWTRRLERLRLFTVARVIESFLSQNAIFPLPFFVVSCPRSDRISDCYAGEFKGYEILQYLWHDTVHDRYLTFEYFAFFF